MSEARVCRHCGAAITRRIWPSGRKQSPSEYAKMRFCSTACRDRSRRKPPTTCSVDGCGRPARHVGLCDKHYRRHLIERPTTEHGRSVTYSGGCRCDDCRLAWTEYRQGHTAEHREEVSEAARPRNRRYRQGLLAATRPTAKRAGQTWTSAELEVVTRDGVDLKETAVLLGRTYGATARARMRALNEPKYIALVGASRA